MSINLTLIIQMVVFAILIWFTMRFVWPIILGAMDERSRKIALGLAAAEKGQAELTQAKSNAEAIIREARERAQHIVDQAQQHANGLIEQAKSTATAEGVRIKQAAQAQIERSGTVITFGTLLWPFRPCKQYLRSPSPLGWGTRRVSRLWGR